jgi:hypothetical protein
LPHNADSVHFLLTDHRIEYGRASLIECPAGKVMVEMLPSARQIGALLVPDGVAEKYRPDIGIVLAAGPDHDLEIGTMVGVAPYDGIWIDGWDAGGYRTANQIRCYGQASPFTGATEPVPVDRSLLFKVFTDGDEPSMQAILGNLIIKREPMVTSQDVAGFNLELSWGDQYQTGLATVLSLGKTASKNLLTATGPIEVGDVVHYNVKAVLDFAFAGDKDLAIIPWEAVNCRVSPEPN